MKLTQEQLEHSKTISYYLRHRPDEIDIVLDEEGYVHLDNFLSKYNYKHKFYLTTKDIFELLEKSDKKRWEISGEYIRAAYGHSVDTIHIDYSRLLKPIKLYHGTPTVNIESIKEKGILSMSRNFVHLTPNFNFALKTAQRISSYIVAIEVDVQKMLDDDVAIYKVSEVIYLTKCVDPKYILIK